MAIEDGMNYPPSSEERALEQEIGRLKERLRLQCDASTRTIVERDAEITRLRAERDEAMEACGGNTSANWKESFELACEESNAEIAHLREQRDEYHQLWNIACEEIATLRADADRLRANLENALQAFGDEEGESAAAVLADMRAAIGAAREVE